VVLLGSLIFANVCSSTFYPTDADLRWRYRNLNVNPVYTQTFSQTGADALLEQRRFAVRTAPGNVHLAGLTHPTRGRDAYSRGQRATHQAHWRDYSQQRGLEGRGALGLSLQTQRPDRNFLTSPAFSRSKTASSPGRPPALPQAGLRRSGSRLVSGASLASVLAAGPPTGLPRVWGGVEPLRSPRPALFATYKLMSARSNKPCGSSYPGIAEARPRPARCSPRPIAVAPRQRACARSCLANARPTPPPAPGWFGVSPAQNSSPP